ncbi:hypothetical protein COX59_01610, partial [Candidatus Beckwithbacteria bacterium CG_4_10_14_0_2_um_filter_47_25]
MCGFGTDNYRQLYRQSQLRYRGDLQLSNCQSAVRRSLPGVCRGFTLIELLVSVAISG